MCHPLVPLFVLLLRKPDFRRCGANIHLLPIFPQLQLRLRLHRSALLSTLPRPLPSQALHLLAAMWDGGPTLTPDAVSYNTALKACANAFQAGWRGAGGASACLQRDVRAGLLPACQQLAFMPPPCLLSWLTCLCACLLPSFPPPRQVSKALEVYREMLARWAPLALPAAALLHTAFKLASKHKH